MDRTAPDVAIEKLFDLMGPSPFLSGIGPGHAVDGTPVIEVGVVPGVCLADVVDRLPVHVDGFPVVARHRRRVMAQPFGAGYASPTRSAVLDPTRIRNEEK